jgi:hypothetical protein
MNIFRFIKELIKVIRNPPDPNWHIEVEAKPSESHPFGGFWKTDHKNDHGLAIGPLDDEMYFVTFCGPGGCFERGSYRQNTTLDSDPDYRIIDSNTIEVLGEKGFTRYYRVDSR